jgi:anti-sigma B factor antagonist
MDTGFVCVLERIGVSGALVTVEGDLDMYTCRQLDEALTEVKTRGLTGHVVVDLSRCSFIDSTGLGTMVKAHKGLATSPFTVVAQGQVAKVLALTRFDEVFAVLASKDEALRAVEEADQLPPRSGRTAA